MPAGPRNHGWLKDSSEQELVPALLHHSIDRRLPRSTEIIPGSTYGLQDTSVTSLTFLPSARLYRATGTLRMIHRNVTDHLLQALTDTPVVLAYT